MPWFLAKKEVFQWLKNSRKTIDLRKGNPKPGEFVVFQSGPNILRLKVVKTESGLLNEVLRLDNFKAVIPFAMVLEDAVDYLIRIYGNVDGVFTAYYVEPLTDSGLGPVDCLT